MEELTYQKSYAEYKQEMDTELKKAAEGFVRIGYLLKVARDTNVLAESGYKSVTEFAEKEYNLDKTQVSRFISINNKFSEGGYSDRLMDAYQGFGYAKLTIMLQLPDEVNEELTPDMTKSEIQVIKEEIEEEKKTTDIEIAMEAAGTEHTEESLMAKVIRQLDENEGDLSDNLYELFKNGIFDERTVKNYMVPEDEKIYSIRIQGMGRAMLSCKEEGDVSITPLRFPNEKEFFDWIDVVEAWKAIFSEEGRENRKKTVCETVKEEEKKEEVAPVQPKEEKKPEPKKEAKVVRSEPPKKEEKKEEPKTMTEPEPEKIEVTAADIITEKVEETAKMQCEEEIPKSEEFMNEPEILGELKVTEPQKEEAQKPLITVTMEEEDEEEDWEDDKTELPKVGDLIYLSGPVTGTNDYPDRFEKAEKTMCDLGYTPINPIACVRLPECCTHEEWMKVDIALLSICKGIFLMRGWENSEGCREEFEAAKKNGKCVMIEAAPGIWHKASEVE